MVRRGILLREETAGVLSLPAADGGPHVQTGIVACVSIAEYEAGRIRRHELTRPDKERERTLQHRYRRGADGAGLPHLPGAGGDRPPDGADCMTGPPEYDFIGRRRRGPYRLGHQGTRGDPGGGGGVCPGRCALHRRRPSPGRGRRTVARLRQLPESRRPGGRGASSPAGRPVSPRSAPDHGLQPRRPGSERPVTEAAFLRADRREISRLARDSAGKSPVRPHEFGMYLGGALVPS